MEIYPEITVQLTDLDGNAYSIMGRVTNAMKKAGLSEQQINEYRDEAMSHDYNYLLKTTMKYVEVT